MSNFKPGWYLIYTRPKHERKVCSLLAERNIGHFFPTVKSLRTWWDRKKYIDLPMFPSYVFVKLKNIQDHSRVLEIEGVSCFVKFGNEIAMVRQHVIDALKLVLQNSSDIEISDMRFRPGRQLIISEGVFAGFPCEIVEYKSEEKLIVRINLLKTNVLASIPASLTVCAEAS